MRIVIDTNVFISATFWKGDSFTILKKIESKEIELIVSQEIIEEYSEVMNYEEIRSKVKIKELEVNFILGELVSNSIIVTPKFSFNAVKTDSDDNKFIDVAVEGDADYSKPRPRFARYKRISRNKNSQTNRIFKRIIQYIQTNLQVTFFYSYVT